MAPFVLLILLVVIASPIAWLISEFSNRRAIRIALGIIAIASTMGVAYLIGHLYYKLNYNAWYGFASKDLIETTVEEIEDGNVDRVMRVLRGLDLQYHPTYESRANYDSLVREAVEQMKGSDKPVGEQWDIPPFSRETWSGHWEDGTGFWIVINNHLNLEIVRSGSIGSKMTDVTLSDDFKTLTFKEGGEWRHELKLKNKYEASHVWHDLNKGSVWKTDVLHKLIRATPAQREFTQQAQ